MRKIGALVSALSEKKAVWPEKVKIEFLEETNQGQPKVAQWRPHSEYLHQVFQEAGLSMGDFNIFYKDKDGEQMLLKPTKMGVEDFLHDHSDPPRLQVRWRPPTFSESAKQTVQARIKAFKDFIGRGEATDEAMKKAQNELEQKGGRVVPSSSVSGRSFIDHKGYGAEKWDEAVAGLEKELKLTQAESEALKIASLRREGKGAFHHEERNGNRLKTAYIAYSTVKSPAESGGDGTSKETIDIVYGKHEETMEISKSVTSLPPENCIQYGGRTFSVWPPGPPHSTTHGTDMCGLQVDLPPGWQIVDSSQEGFENIRKWVIAPYGWHTIDLVTKSGETLKAWRTRGGGIEAGKFFDLSTEVSLLGQSSFKFNSSGSYRILIEALPSASPELINHWKRYVELSAQREWSQRLSLPMAGALSAEQQLSEPSQPSP
ncbi:Uncharacterized protein SCF082_LOCUS31112 [Durusdinium trenchii]|uniref:PB1 domain-containing protein n=1 Tax=Durusdinium trenchii TaxID=1381693 RepID=A0ABP0N3X8_9DINO